MDSVSENRIVFYDAGGHSHDGIDSSLIDYSKYCVWDWDINYITTTNSRSEVQQRNLRGWQRFIIDTVNKSVIRPQGIQFGRDIWISGDQILSKSIGTANLKANSITANEIATDAIKSSNYVPPTPPSVYAGAGTFLDLDDGAINSSSFNLDSAGNLSLTGTIAASEFQGGNFTSDITSTATITGGIIRTAEIPPDNANDPTFAGAIEMEDNRLRFWAGKNDSAVIALQAPSNLGSAPVFCTGSLWFLPLANWNNGNPTSGTTAGMKIGYGGPSLIDLGMHMEGSYYQTHNLKGRMRLGHAGLLAGPDISLNDDGDERGIGTDVSGGTNAITMHLGEMFNEAFRFEDAVSGNYEYRIVGNWDGSAAKPVYTFGTSTNAGMYLDSTTILGFSVNGFSPFKLGWTSPGSGPSNGYEIYNEVQGVRFRHGTSSGDTTNWTNQIGFYWTGSSLQGCVDHATHFYIGGTSDRRIKSEIEDLGNMKETIMALRPVQYHTKEWSRNENGNGFKFGKTVRNQNKEVGLIADEVQQVLPNVVSGSAGNPHELQSISYPLLTPILIKALQEQYEVIADLTSRIEALESA